MRFENIDLNLFIVFDVIHREGNLTRAAEALAITQPAVSNALARLRETLGDPLFVRAGRGVAPTPVAQNMIGPVRQALRQLQASVKDRDFFRPELSDKTFDISISDISASMLLPALMERIAQAAPGTSLRCFQVERRRIATEMASGRLDLAVDISQLTAPVLNRYELLSDRYVCVLRKGHPLARSKLTLERYLSLDHVTVSSRRHGSNYIDIALGRLGRRLTSPLRVQNFQPAIHVVQNSDMSLSAPAGLVRRYDVTIKELPFEIEPQPMVLFWHRNVDDDPANRWMRHLIADVALDLQ